VKIITLIIGLLAFFVEYSGVGRIVLSDFRYTASDYTFGVYTLFLQSFKYSRTFYFPTCDDFERRGNVKIVSGEQNPHKNGNTIYIL
jgi:hypothetical protein